MKIGSTDIVNCKIGSTQVNEVRIGSTLVWQFSSVDPDAQAFITAAGITNPTQQTAINTLVVSLKANGIWTKMKAIYPFVGGTAFAHKFNLKNPLDTNAAFRLVFNGGWTHSATGALPNGTNAYANTFLTPSVFLTLDSSHLSFYSRSNVSGFAGCSIGSYNLAFTSANQILIRFTDNNFYSNIGNSIFITVSNPSSSGYYLTSRTSNVSTRAFKNGLLFGTNSAASVINNNQSIFISARSDGGTPILYDNKQCAFASIGDGLSDTESSNLYTAVQAFNTSLGRSVGPQTVSDADAQAFVTAANIQDQVQADAVNDLVIGLKADGLWTKMSAIYPFVGGDATSHKFNLKDPRDLDIAYRLLFSGGWTHNSNGVTGNKINTFANTFLNYTTLNSGHQSLYSRSNIVETVPTYDMGAFNGGNTWQLLSLYSQANLLIGGFNSDSQPRSTLPNSSGLFVNNRTASNAANLWRNGTKLIQSTQVTSAVPNRTNYIGALNNAGTFTLPSSKNFAFASIGSGLTDTEASNLYTRVQAFQTTLGRQV